MLTGAQEVLDALRRMQAEVQTNSRAAVIEAQALVEASVKKQMTGAHSRGTPTGSAPGSPPEVVTGSLRRSVTSFPVELTGQGAVGKVAPTTVYARIQELGGSTGRGGAVHLPGRPYVEPGLKAVLDKLPDVFARNWGRGLR